MGTCRQRTSGTGRTRSVRSVRWAPSRSGRQTSPARVSRAASRSCARHRRFSRCSAQNRSSADCSRRTTRSRDRPSCSVTRSGNLILAPIRASPEPSSGSTGCRTPSLASCRRRSSSRIRASTPGPPSSFPTATSRTATTGSCSASHGCGTARPSRRRALISIESPRRSGSSINSPTTGRVQRCSVYATKCRRAPES